MTHRLAPTFTALRLDLAEAAAALGGLAEGLRRVGGALLEAAFDEDETEARLASFRPYIL